MKKIIFMAILVFTGTIIFFLPELHALNNPIMPGKWWQRPQVKEKLELTSDQIKKIDKKWSEYTKDIINIKGEIKKKYIDLESLMNSEKIDSQEGYKIAENLSQLQAKRVENRVRMSIDIRRILSLEQYEKLVELKHELGRKLKKRGSNGEKGRRYRPDNMR